MNLIFKYPYINLQFSDSSTRYRVINIKVPNEIKIVKSVEVCSSL